MKLINIIVLSTLLLHFSCQKPVVEDPDACVAHVRIQNWDDTTTPFNVQVYSNIKDYLAKENPIAEYRNLKSGDEIKTATRRNTRLYYEINSDDFRITNWALYHSFYVSVTANITSDFLTPATNASHRRVLLPDNKVQSKWIMIGYLDKYRNNLYYDIPAYMRHRTLTINRNQTATYSYLNAPGDTVSEEYRFTVHNETWASIKNSFDMTFYDTSMLDDIGNVKNPNGQMYYAEGPISQQHPYYAGYNNPPVPSILIPETDVIVLSDPERNKADILFKRLF